MATQTFTTTYEPTEFKTLLADCISETVRSEISKILSNQKPKKTIYTRQETATILDISLPTLNEYTKQGYIVAYRLGYKVRYRIEDIENALIKIKTK
ncbi:helix-turn-helix domain-containing protein [Mucilaginibacter polytrichastri]|uniref:helix-turn-helix domain-containing protein n=1 Tax=Mucilaginibacter polytrichastri TaxID=1302689 RepID=UPI0008ED5AF0|nr:helix-turn-helix domain-containing protein [Mucilaginibacter polytrichastri]SFS47788.1 Helix-turn-helix domain-containing protein [Mucilaginibacter polytrichastri]